MAEDYERAKRLVTDVVHDVPAGAWAGRTLCQDWTVRDLVGHLVDGQWLLCRLADGQGWQTSTEPGQLAGAGPVASWDAAARATAARLDRDALAEVVETPAGSVVLGEFLEQRVSVELLVHAWDLAEASNVPLVVDPGLVQRVSERIRPYGDAIRGPRRYGPRLTTSSTDPLDQLVAYLGRDVDECRSRRKR